jgi:type II restriction enzyme
MPNGRAYDHLRSPNDLVTTYEEIREGFIKLALEKSRKAEPMVQEARQLQQMALRIPSLDALLQCADLVPALLTAAGFSDKASQYICEEDKHKALDEFASQYVKPAGAKYVEELVFRFLLTRGDTLGGSMRNLAGALAQRRFVRCLSAQMRLGGREFLWLTEHGGWIPEDDPETVETRAKGLSWRTGEEHRTLLFNSQIPSLGTINIDLFLLGCECGSYKDEYRDCRRFLALGELKGGIDPAGADEHWKTATRSLTRIREHFDEQRLTPSLFFIGAAIVQRMTEEIWDDLKEGRLENAADLNRDDQMTAICTWLISR